MSGIPLKRSRLDDSDYDPEKCIVCQEELVIQATSSSNGMTRIREAAEIRQDSVSERLKLLDQDASFSYHVNNECYKKYTNKATLERIEKHKITTCGNSCDVAESEPQSSTITRARSNATPRSKPNASQTLRDKMYHSMCVICGYIKHNNIRDKFRVSECPAANKLINAAVYLQDSVYVKICDLPDCESIFGADILYHADCLRGYIRAYEKALTQNEVQQSPKRKIFIDVIALNDGVFQRGNGISLSLIRDECNLQLWNQKNVVSDFNNREVRMLLVDRYGDKMSFSNPKEANKSTIAFLQDCCSKEDMVDMLQSINPIKQCAKEIRQALLNEDFGLSDKFCDANDLRQAWTSIVIPEPVKTFLITLMDFEGFDFEETTVTNDEDDEGDDEDGLDGDNGIDEKDEEKSAHGSVQKKRRILSLYQLVYFMVHSGRKRTPLHILNAEAIHHASRNSQLVTSFHRLGIAMGYDELLRYHNDLASYTVECSKDHVPLPCHFDPTKHCMGMFDNFDHNEDTDTGLQSSHDTVFVITQEKSMKQLHKPNISDTGIAHGARQFKEELPCQQLHEYVHIKKPIELPEDYRIERNLVEISEEGHRVLEKKDLAWAISRLDLSRLGDGVINTVSDDGSQTIPSWSGFNSLITDEELPQQTVGFLPVLPFPVTEYRTVYTALKNFQDILSQLGQSNMAITCDEGVYRIAKEVQLRYPDEFGNVILCLGPFHMIKIVQACIGHYIEGSGAVPIWTKNDVFGINVVKQVLSGKHYKRSLYGLFVLDECIQRLQLAEFFMTSGVDQYREVMILRDMKVSVSQKDDVKSRELLESFIDLCDPLFNAFQEYKDDMAKKSETFKYWDTFVSMVALLRDLVRSVKEGDWALHLHTIKAILPMFAAFNRTNYLRWCSLYLEDMQSLEEKAPDVYRHFVSGNFAVKRTPGRFKSVPADQCLEQTINRSQKSSSGVIGSTKRKQFVAQWELIYHETLDVVNLHREVCGVASRYAECDTNHEFNASQTNATEQRLKKMIDYIKARENPSEVPKEIRLHNIISQAIMTEDVRKSLLNVLDTGKHLYQAFRNERYIDKTKAISDTIARSKVMTFMSVYKDKTQAEAKKENKKEFAEAQRIVDVAKERNYDMKQLLQYDLTQSSTLFDKNGFMTKTAKSTLCTEMEKNLKPEDYSSPAEWTWELKTTYVVDVMGHTHRVTSMRYKTFGQYVSAYLTQLAKLCPNADSIHMVFDTYIEGSVKGSERARRNTTPAVEISTIQTDTLFPVNLDSFWGANSNKQKLQMLIRNTILSDPSQLSSANLVLSGEGTTDESRVPCQDENGEVIDELQNDIEEADGRIIPHILYAVKEGSKRVVVLSNDTDVLVLDLHYTEKMKRKGMTELWQRGGVGNTTRYIPVHVLAEKLGRDICKVLPALHILTGCDSTSKVGTKHSAMKANPVKFLTRFGKNVSPSNSDIANAEKYLVHVLQNGAPFQTMDQLRYYRYFHSKNVLYSELPPTSYALYAHILRCWYNCHIQLNCLKNATLDPLLFAYEEDDNLLIPTKLHRIMPENLPLPCTCKKCATQRCRCRDARIPCCMYCNCRQQNYDLHGTLCKNPNVMLRLPINMQ